MTPEEPEKLSHLVTRVLAKNPGVMTGPGTNTYVVGVDSVVVIDVGPDENAHVGAVEAAVAGRPVEAILSTHHHSDHAPGSSPLAKRVRAPIGARPHPKGPPVDIELEDGMVVACDSARLVALYTPGHASDHLCFLLEEENALFSGDHVMSGSTVVIAPPDGHMETYLASLRRMLDLAPGRIYPGHGPVIDDGTGAIATYIRHRELRKAQVASRLAEGDRTIAEIVAAVYRGVAQPLHRVARFSVQAHLHQLAEEGRAACEGDRADMEAPWRPA